VNALQKLAAQLPDAAKDLRLNLPNVLQSAVLSPAQAWGVALAVAMATRHPELRDAALADAEAAVGAAVVDDAVAAASLMAMNNIYYRFRHLVGRPEYEQKAPRLRMQRLQKPATNAADLELMALAVSAVHGCAMCVAAHESVVTKAGITEDQVHDAIRIAAVIHGLAVAIPIPRSAVA
jgi:lipoyl-dependent peroxiredoxin subunit D